MVWKPSQLVRKPDQLVHEVQFSITVVRALFLIWIGSLSSKLRINHRLFFWILDSSRKVLKSFEIFSQPAGPVGKSNQPVHWVLFAGTTVWVLFFVCVGSWSLGVGIALRLFCWIPEFLRNFFKIFDIFSEPDGPVGKPNHPVHWVMFAGTTVWVLFFIYVCSWSFRVKIALCLFLWISDYVRNVLEIFENFSQSDVLVKKSDLSVH